MNSLFDLSKLKDTITEEIRALNDPSRKKKKVPRRYPGQPARKNHISGTEGTGKPLNQAGPATVKKTATEPAAVPEKIPEGTAEAADTVAAPSVLSDAPAAERLSGKYMQVRLDKSFTARLILSDEELKKYYSDIRNAFLGYSGVHSHISWRGELFRYGKTKLGVVQIRGKMLYLYLALEPDEVTDAKYKGEQTGDVKAFEGMPYCYIVNGDRKRTWACELIARVCEKTGAIPTRLAPLDYAKDYPPDTESNLIDRMLIKEVVYLLDEPPRGWAHADVVGDTISTEGIETYRTDVVYRHYGFVNLTQLNDTFGSGDTVDLTALKRAGLVPPESDAWRVTGSAGLEKPLTVVTNYCPLQAAAVIVSAGGRLKIYKSCSKF